MEDHEFNQLIIIKTTPLLKKSTYSIMYHNQKSIFRYFRSNDDSYSRGVLSEESYLRGKKRSLISLQMCFMGWLYELLSIGSILITPFLHTHGIPNLHFIDAIIMFLVIPFLHLMNDEDTKGIIFEENWYQGIRHMLGIYHEKEPPCGKSGLPSVADPKNKSSPSHNESLKHLIHTTSAHNRVLIRRCHSASSALSSHTLAANERTSFLQRRYSLRHKITEQQQFSFQDPITICLITSIKATTTDTATRMSQSNYSPKRSGKGSMASLDTIHLDR